MHPVKRKERGMRATIIAALMIATLSSGVVAKPADVGSSISDTANRTEANVKLDEGHWRFRIQATTKEGTVYDAYFEQHITP